VDVLFGGTHLTAARDGGLDVPDGRRLVQPGRAGLIPSSSGFTSHSRVSSTGTDISAIISAWIADSRMPLVRSILVRRCIQ
jgi:hypothetical protein